MYTNVNYLNVMVLIFLLGWGRTVGRPMYSRDKPAFCFFFLLKEYPFGAKRNWGVLLFCLLFLKEEILLREITIIKYEFKNNFQNSI